MKAVGVEWRRQGGRKKGPDGASFGVRSVEFNKIAHMP